MWPLLKSLHCFLWYKQGISITRELTDFIYGHLCQQHKKNCLYLDVKAPNHCLTCRYTFRASPVKWLKIIIHLQLQFLGCGWWALSISVCSLWSIFHQNILPCFSSHLMPFFTSFLRGVPTGLFP